MESLLQTPYSACFIMTDTFLGIAKSVGVAPKACAVKYKDGELYTNTRIQTVGYFGDKRRYVIAVANRHFSGNLTNYRRPTHQE